FIHCTDDSPDPCIEYELDYFFSLCLQLVLRKWCELIPGAEFRCFVKENKLIGISQRDYTQYYDHISKQKEEICRGIQDFFKKHIQYKFLDEDFVFDIYRDSRYTKDIRVIAQKAKLTSYEGVDGWLTLLHTLRERLSGHQIEELEDMSPSGTSLLGLSSAFPLDFLSVLQGKVWLIDFNPFGEVTDSLLFTWDELISGRNLKGDFTEGEALEQDSPAFRCTNSEVTVQPSPYLSYRLPKDFVDLSTGEDAHKLIDFLKLVKFTYA
ncbi:Cell division cycle protein 123-like protein, partial [Camelus dromedarius]